MHRGWQFGRFSPTKWSLSNSSPRRPNAKESMRSGPHENLVPIQRLGCGPLRIDWGCAKPLFGAGWDYGVSIDPGCIWNDSTGSATTFASDFLAFFVLHLGFFRDRGDRKILGFSAPRVPSTLTRRSLARTAFPDSFCSTNCPIFPSDPGLVATLPDQIA